MRSSRTASRIVSCAVAIVLGAVGCSSSKQPAMHVIAGAVSGAVQAGVTVTLGGAASATATTDASGNYRFSGVADGSYTVTPSLDGYTFTPSSASVTLAGADVTGRDFTATAAVPSTHAISGTVSGAIQAGVTVTLGGAAIATTTTDGSGNYHFSGLADGNYTVSPTLTGYSFTPVVLPVSLAGVDVTGRNFAATVVPPSTHAISGTITGAVQRGVSIALSGAAITTTTTTTDGYGNYQFTGLADGSYTVTPTSSWYTFTPANVSVTLSGADATGRNFTASGRCLDTTADTSGLTLYDKLCSPTLDGSRWQQPGAFARRVSSGAAWLRTAMGNEESRSVRNSIYSSFAAPVPPRAGDRVTTIRADVMVPSATASRSGGADLRAVVRLLYQPPLTRLVFPGAWQDLLVLEVGVLDAGNGLQAYRQVLHCDDPSCATLSTTGIGVVDPADFAPLGAGLQAGTPAAYDTSYTVLASLDEATGLFHWSIAGGALGELSGTADPTAYLDTAAGWAGVPLAGSGFMSAQMGTSSRDGSPDGGGSVDVTGRFKDVYIGINNAAAALWDDFSGTGTNSGPGGFAVGKWGNWGNTSSLPSSGGLVQSSYLEMPVTGGIGGYAAVVSNNFASPARIDTLQADVVLPSPVSGSYPQAYLQGRFYNDGAAGGAANSALGDVTAMVRITPMNGSANWLVFRCPNATCTGAVTTVGTGTIPLDAASPLHTLRVGFDPTTVHFLFGVDASYVTVDPTVTGSGITSPVPYSGAAHAPFRSLGSSASVSSTATASSMQARFSNVYVGTAPSGCNAIVNDATPVTLTQVAQDAPAATGGALVDGTYRLTAWAMYTGTGGATGPLGLAMSQLVVVGGNTIQLVGQQSGYSEQRGTATLATSGNQVTFTPTCGNVTASTNAYTASSTEFRIYSNDTSGVSEAVFTKQ